MFNFLPKYQKNRDLVGIDLSGDDFVVTHFKITGNKKNFESLIAYKIKGASEEEVVKTVKQVFKDLNLKNPYIINIIPAHLAITKNLEIPSLDAQEIKEIIDLQSSRHTPYAREEIIIDYINIGPYRKSYTKVLLVIVTRSAVRKQLEIMEKAGLKVEDVFFAPEGLSNICSKNVKPEFANELIGIIHVDSKFTDFIISLKGMPIFTRSMPLGTNQIGQDPDNFIVKFTDELKRSIETYQAEDIEKLPTVLLLTGAIEKIKDKQSVLAQNLHMPIQVLPYLEILPLQTKLINSSALNQDVSFFNLAAVLLMPKSMRVNLVPDEMKLKRSFEQRSQEVIKLGIYFIFLLILFGAILISKLYFKGVHLAHLETKFQATNQEAQVLEKAMERIRVVKHYLKNRGYPLEVLMALYDVLPKNIMLTDIKMDTEGNLNLKGTARAMSGVFSFVVLLEDSAYFRNVQTNYTTSRKEKDEDWADFGISCALEHGFKK